METIFSKNGHNYRKDTILFLQNRILAALEKEGLDVKEKKGKEKNKKRKRSRSSSVQKNGTNGDQPISAEEPKPKREFEENRAPPKKDAQIPGLDDSVIMIDDD